MFSIYIHFTLTSQKAEKIKVSVLKYHFLLLCFFNSLCGLRGHHLSQPTNFQESYAGLRWSPCHSWVSTCSEPIQLVAMESSCTEQLAKLSHKATVTYFIHSKLLLFTFNLSTIQYMINISYVWFIVSGPSPKRIELCGFAELQNCCSCTWFL